MTLTKANKKEQGAGGTVLQFQKEKLLGSWNCKLRVPQTEEYPTNPLDDAVQTKRDFYSSHTENHSAKA